MHNEKNVLLDSINAQSLASYLPVESFVFSFLLISNYIFPVYFYRARHTCSELDENTQMENILCQMKTTRRSFKSGWIKSSIKETYPTRARHTSSSLLISS